MGPYAKSYRKGLRLLFARLRSHLETQTLLEGVHQAQSHWHAAPPSTPYPSDHLLHAANYFRKAGDPRSEIIGYHADVMDGLKDQDPHLQHAHNSREGKRLDSSTIPLPDGSHLFVESHGHRSYPGVHAVSVRWTPKGGTTFGSHWHPDEARGLADRFGEAHESVGKAFHEALDRGESHADPSHKFDKSDSPVHFEAYRAPKGGMIADQVYYPGGSLVPDLQKEQFSATSTKTKKPKHTKLRALLKKINRTGSWQPPTETGDNDAEG